MVGVGSGEQALYSVNFDPSRMLFVNRLVGDVQVDDIIGAMLKIRSHPDYALHIPSVWDFGEASLSRITSRQVQEFGERTQSIDNPQRPTPLALVTSRPLDYGIMRQLIGMAGWIEQTYNIFKALDEAVEWIQAHRTDL